MNTSTFSSLLLENKKKVLQKIIGDIDTNVNDVVILGKEAIKNTNTTDEQLIWIYDQIFHQLKIYAELTTKKYNEYLVKKKTMEEKEILESDDPDKILDTI